MLHPKESYTSNMNTSDEKLKVAAQEGDINLLYTVIQEDSYVLDHMDSKPFAETPLHTAACFGHVRFATEITRLKPSFAWKLNEQGFTPIHLAMQHDQKRMVLRFVDMDKELVRAKGREGITPLHVASQTGDIDLLAHFLLACPNSIEDVTVTSETALHIALRYQQYEALHVLVGWLKRTRQKGARILENTILNWKNDQGNTILHVSTLTNDSTAIQLLVKTKVDLNAKNWENSIALDMAENNAEIKNVLVRAGAKHGSPVTDAPTFPDKLRSSMTLLDNIIISILRIRRDTTDEQRNAFLIVAALVATATYQSALSPPGGVYQANAVDNTNPTSSFNSTATAANNYNAGTSVMSLGDFLALWSLNTLSLFVSTMTMFILTPSGTIGRVLFTPMYLFVNSYLYSMKVISPNSATKFANYIMATLFSILYAATSCLFARVYKRLQHRDENKEIKTWNSIAGNRW
ncbi:Ankyrin repeat-containing protein BDA1, partial [Mucuna pruriens]